MERVVVQRCSLELSDDGHFVSSKNDSFKASENPFLHLENVEPESKKGRISIGISKDRAGGSTRRRTKSKSFYDKIRTTNARKTKWKYLSKWQQHEKEKQVNQLLKGGVVQME